MTLSLSIFLLPLSAWLWVLVNWLLCILPSPCEQTVSTAPQCHSLWWHRRIPSMTHADIKFVLHFLGVGFGHVCVIKMITTDRWVLWCLVSGLMEIPSSNDTFLRRFHIRAVAVWSWPLYSHCRTQADNTRNKQSSLSLSPHLSRSSHWPLHLPWTYVASGFPDSKEFSSGVLEILSITPLS